MIEKNATKSIIHYRHNYHKNSIATVEKENSQGCSNIYSPQNPQMSHHFGMGGGGGLREKCLSCLGPLQKYLLSQKPLVSRHNGGMGGPGGDKGRPCEIHLQPPRKNCCRSWLSKFPTRSKRIDVISRITFPLVFAFFNMAYWSTYLFTEEEEDGIP